MIIRNISRRRSPLPLFVKILDIRIDVLSTLALIYLHYLLATTLHSHRIKGPRSQCIHVCSVSVLIDEAASWRDGWLIKPWITSIIPAVKLWCISPRSWCAWFTSWFWLLGLPPLLIKKLEGERMRHHVKIVDLLTVFSTIIWFIFSLTSLLYATWTYSTFCEHLLTVMYKGVPLLKYICYLDVWLFWLLPQLLHICLLAVAIVSYLDRRRLLLLLERRLLLSWLRLRIDWVERILVIVLLILLCKRGRIIISIAPIFLLWRRVGR